MLPQQLPGLRIEETHMQTVPLDFHQAADPTRRRAIVGGLDFDASIQVYRSLAVLVIAKRFERQRQKRRLLFGEHGGDLSLGGAVNACISPPLFPVVEV